MKNSLFAVFIFIAMSIFTFGFLNNEALAVQKAKPEEISPLEDLMREHGVLRRIMLIYEKEIKELKNGRPVRYDVIFKSAGIIHDFIEGYHEKLEEDYIFPIFEKSGKFTELTRTLREQHKAGRKLTLAILQLSRDKQSGNKENPDALAANLRLFIRMYRPHAAREDTILFPALRSLVSEKEYDELGDKFEDKERELFGENGFEGKVKEVAGLEKELGIYELSQFTPAK